MNDLRLSLRRLLKNPGFTAVAMFTMALCIGANVTIFAVVDAILVRSLPFPDADRLVLAYNSYPKAGSKRSGSSLPNYFDRREGIAAFESVSLYQDSTATIGEPGAVERVDTAKVTPEFFKTLGAPLAIGQVFTESEMAYGSNRVVLITDTFWRSHFNADPNVLGQTFPLNSASATVIGVLSRDFRFLDSKAQIFRPLTYGPEQIDPRRRHSNESQMVARLGPDVTLTDAQLQMDAFNAHQLTDDPHAEGITDAGYQTRVVSLHEDHVRHVKPVLILLQIGVLFLLVIGVVNVINLLLIRASSQFKELAVRQALGAKHSHHARSVLTETILLTLGGGMLGILLSMVGIHLLRLLGTDRLPLGGTIGFDANLALLALLGSVVLGACLAIPIIGFNRFYGTLISHLHSESRTGTTPTGIQRLRSGFSVIQVALAFVLLAGAGMFGVSLKRVMGTSPGFESERVLTGHLALPWKNYPGEGHQVTFATRLLPNLKALPGVTHAAISTALPFTTEAIQEDSAITPEGFVPSDDGSLRTHYFAKVSADYWKAMDIPLLEGRLLTDTETTLVAVVDAAFARRYWPSGSAVGRRFSTDVPFDPERSVTVVGVVGSVKQTDLVEEDGHGAAYLPFVLSPSSSFRVLVRSETPEMVAPMVRNAILELDPELPISDLKTMQSHIDESLTVRRSPAILVAVFAGVALLLAAIGTYGVLAYAVSQRRREIGVRMALGALPRQIRYQFLSMGMRLLVVGTLIGLAGAWATGRAMQNILFEVPALHWPTLLGAIAVIAIATLFACLLPSGRAARIQPTEALRSN